MYREEKWENGKLYWRGTPNGEWIEANTAYLYQKLKEVKDAYLHEQGEQIAEMKAWSDWARELCKHNELEPKIMKQLGDEGIRAFISAHIEIMDGEFVASLHGEIAKAILKRLEQNDANHISL